MKYRLKPEAVEFFKEKHATTIQDWDYWSNIGVDEKALEEVQDAFITYGHESTTSKEDGYSSASISGWGNKEGSHFNFTIHYPSTKHCEHDKFSNGKITRELMNKMQSVVDNHYKQFVNDESN